MTQNFVIEYDTNLPCEYSPFALENFSLSGYKVSLYVYSNQSCLMYFTFKNYVLRKWKITQDKNDSYFMRKFCVIVKWYLWSDCTLFLKVTEFFWSYDIFEIDVIVLEKENNILKTFDFSVPKMKLFKFCFHKKQWSEIFDF